MTIQTEQSTRSKTFDITIVNVDIQSSTDEGNQIIIQGPGEFEITAEKDSQGNYTIPNFSDSVSGKLIVNDKSTIELREIPPEDARELILEYISEHYGAKTSDIIFDLALNVDLVLRILKELNEKEDIVPVST